MATIIDSHVHVFPDTVGDFLAKTPAAPVSDVLNLLRRKGRERFAPIRRGLHTLQPLLRHVPENVRMKTDLLSYTSVFSSLLIEATPRDLLEAMNEDRVSKAVIIAAPPHASNEFILDSARRFPDLIPIVNLPPDETDAPAKLERYVSEGAKGLKIHAAIDGEGPGSPHYRGLLAKCAELNLPVIIHTGCIHMKLVYKDPEMGHAGRFEPWFSDFPTVRFVLAHMNFHEPEVALELAGKYPNLFVETSWQPPSVIAKAVLRLGASRVLFGTDWPLVGDNITVGLKRIQACVDQGKITAAEAELILGKNAAKLFA